MICSNRDWASAALRRVVVSAAVVVLLFSGCGGASQGSEKVAPGPAPTLRNAAEYSLPLMGYVPSHEERLVIDRGVSARQVACAARYGVVISPEESDPTSLQAEYDHSRRYGVVDRSEVEQYGYGQKPSSYVEPDRESRVSEPGRDEVLSGKTDSGEPSAMRDQDGNPLPDGGCGKIGWDDIREGTDIGTELPQQLLGEAYSLMLENEDFQAAEKDWVACMKRSGYDFEHRWDAGNSVGGEDEQRRREMALLDLGCAEEVNYVGRAYAVDVAIQNKLIQDNESGLRGALDVQRRVLERAKEALK